MARLIIVLAVIFGVTFAIVIWTNNSGPEMDISGNKFQTIDEAVFGKGKDAKICPVSGFKMKPAEGEEAVLSNGKKIMICCLDCKPAIERNLKKYAILMY